MSTKQEKIRAFAKGLIDNNREHPATVPLDVSSLRTIRSHWASAYELLAVFKRILEQWELENKHLDAAFPIVDLNTVADLIIRSVIVDVAALRAAAKTKKGDTGQHENATEPDTGVAVPSLSTVIVEDPATRRKSMLLAKDILATFSESKLKNYEDVDELIPDDVNRELVLSLLSGIRPGTVTTDPNGDIDWAGVAPIKQKLSMREELVFDGELFDIGRLNSRRLEVMVKKLHSHQFEDAVALKTAKGSKALVLRYDSNQLERRILRLTSVEIQIQYRATVSRGFGGTGKFEFTAFQADPIVDGKVLAGMSNADVNELVIERLKMAE